MLPDKKTKPNPCLNIPGTGPGYLYLSRAKLKLGLVLSLVPRKVLLGHGKRKLLPFPCGHQKTLSGNRRCHTDGQRETRFHLESSTHHTSQNFLEVSSGLLLFCVCFVLVFFLIRTFYTNKNPLSYPCFFFTQCFTPRDVLGTSGSVISILASYA